MTEAFFNELPSLFAFPMRQDSSLFASSNTCAMEETVRPALVWDPFSKYAHVTANGYAIPTLVEDEKGMLIDVALLPRKRRRFLPPPLTHQAPGNTKAKQTKHRYKWPSKSD